MFEKRLQAVPPQLFTANGTVDGLVTVPNAAVFRVKQLVNITATGRPPLNLEVKRVLSETVLYVGPPAGNIDSRTDLSLYTVASAATISAIEQKRPSIPEQDVERLTYEEEPVVARRVVMVDKLGKIYDDDNPLPIAFDGTISVGNVTIQDDDGDELGINADGSINVNVVNSASSGGLLLQTGEVTAVASGVETNVVSLSASMDRKVYKVDVSGNNCAVFKLKLNGTTLLTKRIWHAHFNEVFTFEDFSSGLQISAGDNITVTVAHSRPALGAFEATISYV